MVNFKQKLNLVALIALIGSMSIQARPVAISGFNANKAGLIGGAVIVTGLAAYGAYKWWNGRTVAPEKMDTGVGLARQLDTPVESRTGWLSTASNWLFGNEIETIKAQLFEQKLAGWRDGAEHSWPSGAEMKTANLDTLMTSYKEQFGVEIDGKFLDRVKQEKAALKKICERLAAKIDKKAMKNLNAYLSEKLQPDDQAEPVDASLSSSSKDIFEIAQTIEFKAAAGLSWVAIRDQLSGMFKNQDKKELVELFWKALVRYSRAQALETLAGDYVRQMQERNVQRLDAIYRLQDALNSHLNYEKGCKVDSGPNKGHFMITLANLEIVDSAIRHALAYLG